jgi:hypothetical protein
VCEHSAWPPLWRSLLHQVYVGGVDPDGVSAMVRPRPRLRAQRSSLAPQNSTTHASFRTLKITKPDFGI